jgi:hypothetical protein
MQTTETLQLVERYLDAIRARDFAAARALLASRGFEYLSPIARFDDADRFAESMEAVGAILHDIRTRYRFADGDLACHILDVTVSLDAYQTQRVVQLARVAAAKIIALEVIFDASQFHRMIGQDGAT